MIRKFLMRLTFVSAVEKCRFSILFIVGSIMASGFIANAQPKLETIGVVYNIRDFGAIGDGSHLDSESVNRAIQAATGAGGGTVWVPAGTYLCGSIHLASNIHLYLDSGAVILGAPQELQAYDETEPFEGRIYQDGGHTYFHNSLIWGENLINVVIDGHGEIKGGGLVRQAEILNEMTGFKHWETPNTQTYPPVRIGNKAIALKRCRNILIRDITIFHGGHFGLLATGCDHLTVDNVSIDTNRDGMDIDACRDTFISNCRVNSPSDDGICIKSSYALGEMRLTENLTIVNCQVSGYLEGTMLDATYQPKLTGKEANGRIKFGTESTGGFRNCTISNCTFRQCNGLALEEVDGGLMENITINNLTMLDMRDYGIYITTGSRNRSPDSSCRSRARNILISNVIMDNAGKLGGIQIYGQPGHPLEGVRLENIQLITSGGGEGTGEPKELGKKYPEPSWSIGPVPAYGIYARHVKGLELANIHLGFQTDDARPALVFADIQGLELENIKPQLSTDVPAALFADDVRDLVIRDSPKLKTGKK